MHSRRQVLYGLGAVGASVSALRTSALFGSTAISGTAVNFDVPRGACDCHVHIFDPARFSYAAKRVYTPPAALLEDLLELQKAMRMDCVVVVQPSVYGSDNSCTLDAVRRLGSRARGRRHRPHHVENGNRRYGRRRNPRRPAQFEYDAERGSRR